jgi:membrane protease YdiL (CAAX protease family)
LSLYLVAGPQWIRSASSFLVDRFCSDQIFHRAGKEAHGFRRCSFRDLSIRFRLSTSRFRNSGRGFTSAFPQSFTRRPSRGRAFVAFQYFLSGGGAAFRHGQFHVNQLLVALPLCFIWLFVEAGLVEEFFFRALVQSNLAAAFKSEVGGTVLMSLIFGLAHAPGFIFRHAGEVEGLGSNPSALDAVAYSIVVLAISGVTFGVIWARTKNLFAVMLIHAAGDLLPNFAGFAQTWL